MQPHPQQQHQEGQRPHTISSSFERGGLYNRPLLNGQTFLAPDAEKKLPNSEPVSPSKINNGIHSDLQTYSTIKRSYRYSKLFHENCMGVLIEEKIFFCNYTEVHLGAQHQHRRPQRPQRGLRYQIDFLQLIDPWSLGPQSTCKDQPQLNVVEAAMLVNLPWCLHQKLPWPPRPQHQQAHITATFMSLGLTSTIIMRIIKVVQKVIAGLQLSLIHI